MHCHCHKDIKLLCHSHKDIKLPCHNHKDKKTKRECRQHSSLNQLITLSKRI